MRIEIDLPEEDVAGPIEVYNQTESLEGLVGEASFTLPERDITELPEIETDLFEARGNDTTNETTVELTLIVDADQENIEQQSSSDTFTVTVHNHKASGTSGGTVDTTITSQNEVST